MGSLGQNWCKFKAENRRGVAAAGGRRAGAGGVCLSCRRTGRFNGKCGHTFYFYAFHGYDPGFGPCLLRPA